MESWQAAIFRVHCKDTVSRIREDFMNQQIIMNFSAPPSTDDLQVIADAQLEILPDEFSDHIEELTIQVEDMPDETTLRDLDVDDAYELLAHYKAGKELSPGVEKKAANDDDVLILYRRPILDLWSESGDDLTQVVREAMIGEIGDYFEFSEDDIDDMTERHYQGML